MREGQRHGIESHLWWVVLNVAGMALYLRQASSLWSSGATEGLPPGYAHFWGGDAFYWLLTMVPVLVFFLLADVAILVFLLVRTRETGRRHPLGLWLAVAMLWMATLGVDGLMRPTLVDAGTTAEDILRQSPR